MRIAVSLWNQAGKDAPTAATRLHQAGAGIFHWDRSDGGFCTPGGFTWQEASTIAQQLGSRSEAHLMLSDPLKEVDPWCDFCELVAVHLESNDALGAIRRIARRGVRPAIAISPQTPISLLPNTFSAEIAILVMSVVPGLAGSSFLPDSYQRIRDLSPRAMIGVDGSVTLARLLLLEEAGASWVAVGTDLVNAADPALWLKQASAPKDSAFVP
ncbi:MAG: hypothetical protein LBU38_02105 [Propionibacteriaceae bacterium]|jgi:ribulose-phosphate 3-epimerase|nr:hypothetical protein [Propionibacteriaceae bacterium]